MRTRSRYPRSKFLEATTLGLGAVIGGIVTVPVLGFAILPPFIDQGHPDIDLGPLDDFPEGKFMITTFMLDPAQGEVSRRTAYVRNNGLARRRSRASRSSRTAASHLGCPVQPNGPPLDEQKDDREDDRPGGRRGSRPRSRRLRLPVPRRPVRHRGQPHRRPARARARPLRVLDQQRPARPRQRVQRREGRGHGQDAKIQKYPLARPGPARRRPRGSGSTRSSRPR